jgi:putative ABC transport system substrate-binding protein
MRRRDFIPLIMAATAWPFAVCAQQTKVTRIGFLSPASPSNRAVLVEAFRAGLRELGYVEGKNIVIEFRWAEGNYDRLPALATELVHLQVDVLMTHSNPGVLAAKQATTTIPIIMIISGDAVGSGLVRSLNRPGGNVTGQTFFNPELNAKRLEFLKEMLPQIHSVATLFNPNNPIAQRVLQAMALMAVSLKLEIKHLELRQSDELASAFSQMVKHVDAVVVIDDPIFGDGKSIVDLAMAQKIPAIGYPELAEAGGLMAYGVDYVEIYRHAAVFVDKIAKGAKPDDLPVEQPTSFKLVINLKTAKALGLAISPSLLARADEVIE